MKTEYSQITINRSDDSVTTDAIGRVVDILADDGGPLVSVATDPLRPHPGVATNYFPDDGVVTVACSGTVRGLAGAAVEPLDEVGIDDAGALVPLEEGGQRFGIALTKASGFGDTFFLVIDR